MHCKKVFPIFFFLLTLSHLMLPKLSLAEIALIRVHFRDATEMLPLVKTMLSEKGRATAEARSNSIVVRDRREVVENILDLVAHLDKPAEQVTIRFKFQQRGTRRERDISASGTVSADKWSVSIGERDTRNGIHLRAGARRLGQRQDSESIVSVLSGNAAYIRVGEEIPYTRKWIYLCRRYARLAEREGVKRIETGMEVKPVLSGNHVQIEIVPRISFEELGNERVIRFLEASTKLSIPRGQWITIGGHENQGNEVIGEILSKRKAGDRRSSALSLMVDP